MNTLQTEPAAKPDTPAAKPAASAAGSAVSGALALHLPADVVGDAVYLVGFWAEYGLLCGARWLVRVGGALLRYIANIARRIWRPIAAGVRGFFRDLARPFVQLAADLRTLRELGTDAAVPDQPTRREYMHARRKLYRQLFWQAFSFLLPLAALAAFVLIVRAGLSLHYVLDVQVDGQSVGYVQSEQVFESARADVQNRLNNARAALAATGGVVEQNWEIRPSYTLTVGGAHTMTEAEAANAIMRVSSDEIGEGTAVYVDGTLQFVTTEGDHLRAYLENIKAPYEDALDVNTRAGFLHDIRLEDGLYMLSSVADYSKVIDTFNQNPETLYYTAGSKETCQSAVDNTGIGWDALAQMNPWMLTLDQKIPEGTAIVTGVSSPEWLKVKVISRRTYTEAIPYSTDNRTSNQYDFGQKVVLQEGQTGMQEVTQDITYIDGRIASADIINTTVLSEPVTRIVITGTRIAEGMYANPGSGSFVWPVPNYTYVSRWMSGSHAGADICAPLGTPIIAADSGYVVTSVNGAGTSSWAYGQYVIIDHGNGWTTRYAHMSSRAVSAGDMVQKGQVIGYVGSTGRSTGPHCHFEMKNNGVLYSARNLWPNMRTW